MWKYTVTYLIGLSRVALILTFFTFLVGSTVAQQKLPNAPSTSKAKAQTGRTSDTGWPRTFTSGTDTFVLYQPQVDKWDGNRVDLYSAVEFKAGKDSPAKYGVVWFQARTEVDKLDRLVTLDQAQVTKVKFPVAPDKEAELTALLDKKLPGVTKTISLDRLEAALEANGEPIKGVEVKNDPPKVIFAAMPSLLVLIDGMPQLREIQGTKLGRVINTRAILLFESDKKKYYLRLQDWWLEAKDLEGPWSYAKKLPDDMKKAEEYVVTQAAGQTLQNDQAAKQPSLKEAGKKAEIPAVYVVFGPAELIETKSEPVYKPIPGTSLEYAENTNGNLFRLSSEYYILISGRWFKSASLEGPWTFVNGSDMPSDFAKIPQDSPKATVLASVPGTSESKDALIANSIPQTATITRSEAKLTVQYDGEATFVPIEGTSMTYAKNTSAPVIKVSDNNYYSVEAGVWFKAPTPQGPWRVADTVPAQIYDIPPSSPLYYVTYVKVFSSTPEVVYVGYTPGYYGTVVSASTTTVVYGTGWYYPPYISPTVWYGWPYTYGVGAGFTYSTDSGWSFGFGYAAMATIPGITRGGDRWATTDTAGIRITVGVRGAVRQLPTCTEFGATPPTRVRRRHGPTLTPETTEQPRVAPTITLRPAGPQSPVAAPIPTSTPAILLAIAVARPITRTPASWQAAEQDTPATSIPARARQDAADSPTTPTPALGWRQGKTMSTPARMERCTATIVTAAAGRATAAAAGSPPPSRTPICNVSNRCALRARSGRTTSTPWVARGWAAHAWAVAAGGGRTRARHLQKAEFNQWPRVLPAPPFRHARLVQ